jgi:hypothetical protein
MFALLVVSVVVASGCTASSRQGTSTPVPPSVAPVAVATPSPTVTASSVPPSPTSVPPPKPTVAAPARPPLYVANTGQDGLTLRRAPGGDRIAVLPDGSVVTPTGEEQQQQGRTWRQVKDDQGREGWVAADFLTANAPPPGAPTSASVTGPTIVPTAPVVAATPTAPAPPIVAAPATATRTSAAPAVPVAPPAIIAPAAPKPAPPAAAATSTPPPVAVPPVAPKPATVACCRRCSAGKPCGDSCISRDKNCNVGPGCACSALGPPSSSDTQSVMAPDEIIAEALVLAELNEGEVIPCETFAMLENVE